MESQMSKPELVKGGQGRSSESLTDSANWIMWCAAICVIVLFVAWVVND